MSLGSWGNYTKPVCNEHEFLDEMALAKLNDQYNVLIPYGNGRSYGDSALAPDVAIVKSHNHFLDFDPDTGILHVQSGVILADIIDTVVPQGWFLKVTPGTKLITIGGAIASDVHGKNHHLEGAFSETIINMRLMLPSGEIVNCSKHENVDIYRATCGGMGLTGIILDAKLSLKKIPSSYIKQTTVKADNLKELFDAFEQYKSSSYSVAWVDCLANKENLGRGKVMIGEFTAGRGLSIIPKVKLSVPFMFPRFILNKYTVNTFNWLYSARVKEGTSQQIVDINSFFYPLDSINHWNKIYGRQGFIQYQFILPKKQSYEGMKDILKVIANSGKASFLAVLKLYGKENDNYLSFPMEGYSLALDFKMEDGLLELLNSLDEKVLKYEGRIYLAKDARVSKRVFESGYPKLEEFRAVRKKYNMDKKYHSYQSMRIGN